LDNKDSSVFWYFQAFVLKHDLQVVGKSSIQKLLHSISQSEQIWKTHLLTGLHFQNSQNNVKLAATENSKIIGLELFKAHFQKSIKILTLGRIFRILTGNM